MVVPAGDLVILAVQIGPAVVVADDELFFSGLVYVDKQLYPPVHAADPVAVNVKVSNKVLVAASVVIVSLTTTVEAKVLPGSPNEPDVKLVPVDV